MLSIAVWNICTETNIYSDHNCNTYHFMKTVMLSANFKYKWEWNAQRNKPVTCWIYQTIKVGNNGFPALIKKSRLNQGLHDNGTYKYKHKQFAADFKLEATGRTSYTWSCKLQNMKEGGEGDRKVGREGGRGKREIKRKRERERGEEEEDRQLQNNFLKKEVQ